MAESKIIDETPNSFLGIELTTPDQEDGEEEMKEMDANIMADLSADNPDITITGGGYVI